MEKNIQKKNCLYSTTKTTYTYLNILLALSESSYFLNFSTIATLGWVIFLL